MTTLAAIRYRTLSISREQAAAGMLLAALTASVSIQGLAEPLLVVYLCCGMAALVLGASWRDWRLLVLVGGVWLGIVGGFALNTDASNLLMLVAGTLCMVPVFMQPRIARLAIQWLPAVGLFHAAVILVQSEGGLYRATGIVLANPNPAGGLLVLAATLVLTSKYWRRFTPFILAAIPLTGSRWAVVVMALLFVPLVLDQRIPKRTVALIVLATAALIAAFLPEAMLALRLHGATVATLTQEVAFRSTTGGFSVQSVIPNGVIGYEWLGSFWGAHNVVIRIAIEAGLLSAIAWLSITAILLWRGIKKRDAVWWGILAVCALGGMDYYMWMPFQLTAVWWALIAAGKKA